MQTGGEVECLFQRSEIFIRAQGANLIAQLVECFLCFR